MELLKNINRSEEEIEGEVFFGLFDKYIGFYTEGTVDLKYIEKCANYLNSLKPEVIESLCLNSILYCNYFLALDNKKTLEFETPEDVLELINPACLIVPYPKNENEPVIHLELNCKWEVEHGMEWIVRNDKVLYVGPYYGEDPWGDFSEKLDWHNG